MASAAKAAKRAEPMGSGAGARSARGARSPSITLLRGALLAWELPQNVLGAALFLVQGLRRKILRARFDRERVMVQISGAGAVSLGLFVFFSDEDNAYVPVGPENRDHEYGHSIQSRLLGPLYLLVVGVPSEMRVAYAVAHKHLRGRRWGGYYDGFPENWADRLGGVDKTLRPAP
jgi:hypothetical protein